MRNVRVAAYAAPFVGWVMAVVYFGVTGTNSLMILLLATSAGYYLGHFVVEHYIGTSSVSWQRVLIAIVLCLLPSYFWVKSMRGQPQLGNGEQTTMTPTSAPTRGQSRPTGDIVAHVNETEGALVDQRKRGLDEGHREGFVEGVERATKPTKRVARFNDEVVLVPLGNGQYSVSFRRPGPDLIDTRLPWPCGMTYYVATTRKVPNLQIGWLDDTGKSKFSMPQPGELRMDHPMCCKMESNTQNARLVFKTTLVPDGEEYEIRIISEYSDLKEGEYAPGVPSKGTRRAR